MQFLCRAHVHAKKGEQVIVVSEIPPQQNTQCIAQLVMLWVSGSLLMLSTLFDFRSAVESMLGVLKSWDNGALEMNMILGRSSQTHLFAKFQVPGSIETDRARHRGISPRDNREGKMEKRKVRLYQTAGNFSTIPTGPREAKRWRSRACGFTEAASVCLLLVHTQCSRFLADGQRRSLEALTPSSHFLEREGFDIKRGGAETPATFFVSVPAMLCTSLNCFTHSPFRSTCEYDSERYQRVLNAYSISPDVVSKPVMQPKIPCLLVRASLKSLIHSVVCLYLQPAQCNCRKHPRIMILFEVFCGLILDPSLTHAAPYFFLDIFSFLMVSISSLHSGENSIVKQWKNRTI
ncbi:hypothetical protein MKZ38_006098 [Zalerion maritima]|uniref:Uncharacterized protein n=1 Tax=Zalerion maritima TaxID=339359 RepID=A0AAD5RVQ5_9PEZI|nr:hypothetical protein MKZ38_006098 [Zalerion maritima]